MVPMALPSGVATGAAAPLERVHALMLPRGDDGYRGINGTVLVGYHAREGLFCARLRTGRFYE